jgi:hypothetical protein
VILIVLPSHSCANSTRSSKRDLISIFNLSPCHCDEHDAVSEQEEQRARGDLVKDWGSHDSEQSSTASR